MNTADRVRDYLRSVDLRRARATHCAELLGISDPTLRRYLRAEGANFFALLDDEKRRRALELLA